MNRIRNLLAFGLIALVVALSIVTFWILWIQANGLIHPAKSIAVVSFAANDLDTTQEVSFTTSDGLRLDGWYIAPTREDGATLLFIHGVGGNRAEFLQEATFVADAGYGALLFDLRNHGSSEGEQTTMGLDEVKDVQAAFEFLASQAKVDSENIVLVGHSMGGAIAILSMPKLPLAKAAIIDTSYTTMIDVTGDTIPIRTGVPTLFFHHIIIGLSNLISGNNLYAVRPIDAVAQIAPRPLLFIHGSNDPIIPIEHTEQLFAAAGEPKELYVVEGAEHANNYEIDPETYQRRVLAFLEEYVVGD